MVDHGQRLFRMPDSPVRHAQPFEGLRAGDFMHEVAIDVEKTGAVILAVDDVVVEDLVVEGARCAHVRKSVDQGFARASRAGEAGPRGRVRREASVSSGHRRDGA